MIFMDEKSPHLPAFEIEGQTSGKKEWKKGDAWNGLTPGVSTRVDVAAVLGAADEVSEMANGECFDYRSGKVRVTFIEGNESIAKIWLSADLNNSDLIPVSLGDAISRFGALKATKLDALSAQIYERPGVRLATVPGTTPERVIWVELYQPS